MHPEAKLVAEACVRICEDNDARKCADIIRTIFLQTVQPCVLLTPKVKYEDSSN
jgi:hypothetical protein